MAMYYLFCGAPDTMEFLAEHGVKALNPRTRRHPLISKTVKYEVRYIRARKPGDVDTAELWTSEDLRKIAEDEGLILL